MEVTINGTIIKVYKQWWLKINTKAFRLGTLDGALFPHVIKVKYVVNEKEYFKLKWVGPYKKIPTINQNVIVVYKEQNPKKARILL